MKVAAVALATILTAACAAVLAVASTVEKRLFEQDLGFIDLLHCIELWQQ